MMLCQSSRLVRSMPRKIGLMPALFTSASIRPCRASTASRKRQHVRFRRDTSVGVNP